MVLVLSTSTSLSNYISYLSTKTKHKRETNNVPSLSLSKYPNPEQNKQSFSSTNQKKKTSNFTSNLIESKNYRTRRRKKKKLCLVFKPDQFLGVSIQGASTICKHIDKHKLCRSDDLTLTNLLVSFPLSLTLST